jgi:hypothetical protein
MYVEIDVFESTTSMKDIKVEGVDGFQMTGDTLKTRSHFLQQQDRSLPDLFNRRNFRFQAPRNHGNSLIRVTAQALRCLWFRQLWRAPMEKPITACILEARYHHV